MIRYANAAAFKQAVEARLRGAASSGRDFERRRQILVFERFLARLTLELGDSMIRPETIGGPVGGPLERRGPPKRTLRKRKLTEDLNLRPSGS